MMVIFDEYEAIYAAVRSGLRLLQDLLANEITEEPEEPEKIGESIDYDKPDYPPYSSIAAFRPFVINQLMYTSGFL